MSKAFPYALLAQVCRSGRVESEHFGIAVICDGSGRVVRALGDESVATYLRSAAKPFQATTCLLLGAAKRFQWTDEELAVVSASHSAEPEHLERVRAILARAGLTPDDLGCGPHPPLHAGERDSLIRAGIAPQRIHNNCSGKHAGMLAACRAMSWDIASYLERSHPLQQANLKTMGDFAGMDGAGVPTGVDGCGVPTFYLPVSALATAYARLGHPESLPEGMAPHARRVRDAMMGYPILVAGHGRFTVDLAESTGRRILLKTGAEGVIAASIPELSLGVVVKIADGSSRVHAAVLCRLLADLLPDLDWNCLEATVNPPIENTRGQKVGEIIAQF